VPEKPDNEIGIRKLRETLPDVLHDVSVRGRIMYVTNHGRRVAALVPVPEAEALEAAKQPETPASS
jgi:prevent-host-death family protein